MKFQIRGAEGFNRVYIPFITPRVVDVETNAPTFAFPCELFRSIRAVYGEARKLFDDILIIWPAPVYKWKSESDMTYDQVWWPILGICAYPILSAHTQQWTRTHREHTPGAVSSHLCCGARGAVGGSVPCLKAPQSWYWGWNERCTFTPPTYNSCRPETL